MKIKTLSAAVVSALLLATAPTLQAQESSGLDVGRMAISGYGDVSYVDSKGMNSNVVSRFIPIFLFQLSEKIHIESELEFSINENGETVVEMEYADLHYFLNDNTTISAGKFLLPFGQFGQNLHPSWVNKLPTVPGIYGHGPNGSMRALIPMMNDTGVNVSNVFKVGPGKLFTDFYVVSGPREETIGEGTGINGPGPEVAFESKKGDNNGQAAFGGRIAYALLPQIEVGYSYYSGAYNADGSLRYTMTNIDASWIGTYSNVRGEYITTTTEGYLEEDNNRVHDFERDGWYVQGAWQARQLGNDWLNPVELVLRKSKISKIDGGDRTTFGVNYWLEPSAVLKVAFEETSLDSGLNDNRAFMQLAFGF